MDEDEFERAKKVLIVLKAVDYKWTIKEVLDQPERLLNQVMALDLIGNKMLSQIRKQQIADAESAPHGRRAKTH